MELSPTNFNANIKMMQELLKRLEYEYELYFGGGRRYPPTKEHKELEKAIRDCAKLALSSTQNQYIFNNFQHTYALRNARWVKLLELKLNGISEDPRLAGRVRLDTKAFQDLEKARPEDVKRQMEETKATPPAKEKEAAKTESQPYSKELFDEYNKAKQALGQTLELDPAAFEKKLEKQKKELIEKHKAKDVKFTVSVVDGKVSLKAKLIK
ncbi:MAG: hypothetical protein N2445_01315 [Acidobacteria bacterium]|nr:hypothetical protein [Acidobacteriota bacterium]